MSLDIPRDEFIKGMFGSKYRLDIWAAIGKFSLDPPEKFYAKKITDELLVDLPNTVISAEFKNLERLGMIERLEDRCYRPGQEYGARPIWFARSPSLAWDIVTVALEVVQVEFPE